MSLQVGSLILQIDFKVLGIIFEGFMQMRFCMVSVYYKSIFTLLFLFSLSFQIQAQDSLTTVTAKKGDGILSLLRKQGMNPYEVYDDFIEDIGIVAAAGDSYQCILVMKHKS